ncbi:MAG: hypothetical protein Q4Q55_06545 [Methanobrevibacter sp.]|nr:hypothetical protein [Methanobrevibacter sp.]
MVADINADVLVGLAFVFLCGIWLSFGRGIGAVQIRQSQDMLVRPIENANNELFSHLF